MTQCVTICHQCVDDSGRAKRWESLCVDCAETTVNTHRRHSGHTDIELRIVDEFTADDVATRVQRRRAFWAARGWAG